uniref:ATP synthase subunit a n=1 Tax=Gonatodes albogularis TaxID=460622 RepID=A0A1Y1CC02_GONAL|nr:ATP synthase F0 subunit 6 [Gonatodes albogularis]BAX77889.1 ATPase subunit 6 [Gonatodes albogularis]
MTMNCFDQFLSPRLLGVPLILLAMVVPTAGLAARPRLLSNRTTMMTTKMTTTAIKQLLLPINTPGHSWALLFLALLLYLLFVNLLGLLPYTFSPTTQLSINMALALPLWLMTVLLGLRTQPTVSLGHLLPPGTPTPLIPVLITIETISLMIRPIALGVRLTANLTAGHLLLQLISTAITTLASLMPLVAVATMIILLLLTLLELAVAMIQAYVFTLLLTLYLQENV